MSVGKKARARARIQRTLPLRAVDGSRRKILSRKRHQEGQLLKLKNGYAVRYYEREDGHRQRVQKFLGTFDELPTRRSALNAMQAEMSAVNSNICVRPQQSQTTFRQRAMQWIEDCEQRKQKPLKPAVSNNWRGVLKNHLLPLIGEIPLCDVGNRTLRSVVERLSKKGLSASTMQNILLVAKLTVASDVDDDGNQRNPRKWNSRYIDAPPVNSTEQHKPSFTGDEVTRIVAATSGRLQMLVVLLASTGLRVGEALALECRHFDGSSVTVQQAAYMAQIIKPKTKNAYRVIDLDPAVAELLKTYIGKRTTGFIFCSSNSARPMSQSNLLRRELHPVLASLGISMRGFHSFRRYRNTFLRQSHCPDGLLKFWMGHSDASLSDVYDRSREDLQYRRDVAKSMGTGFVLPAAIIGKGKTLLLGVNGRQTEVTEQCVNA
jgi:integrase